MSPALPPLDLSTRVAIKALQRMFLAFTGRELPEADAIRLLLEQAKNEDK